MFLHKVATLAAVAAAQYANYNYFDVAELSSVGKQQLAAGEPHTNGLQCESCIGLTEAQCNSNAVTVYCEGEQFHCYTVEKRHFGQIVYVEKGCKQDLACHNEFNLNNRDQGLNIKGAPLKQCYGTDNTADVSICRQCCSTNDCNDALTADWSGTGNHDFDHLYKDIDQQGNIFHNGK